MTRLQTAAMGLAVICACTSGTWADSKAGMSDPTEILKKADAAAKALKIVQYEAKAYELDGDGSEYQVAQGSATVEGFDGEAPEKFSVTGVFNHRGSKKKHELSVGSDGDQIYMMDRKSKKAYVGYDFDVFGTRGDLLMPLLMAEYLIPEPFADEIKVGNKKLVGTTKIAGESCYEVIVQYSDDQKAHWYLSTEDFLPRRVDRFFMQAGRGSRLVVSKLKANPKLEKGHYAFKLPAGFEQVDGFAP